jgi:alpha-tubulin suppressor-like RCC1 family protein
LAIKTDKSLWAWGNSQFGQLGQGNLTNRSSPVQITGDWKEVASQHVFVLGIKDAGTLWGWGRGSSGQIGNGLTNSYSSPVQVGSDTTWEFVTGGYNHSHALKS